MLEALPRFPLAALPTPLEEAPRLSEVLGGPRIWFKRDDNTGLAMGGNKARKLEFIVADALTRGADLLITTGGPQSNHCRMTAAAARRAGLEALLVLEGVVPAGVGGNLLLDSILGARVEFFAAGDEAAMARHLEDRARALAADGRRPYVIPMGGSVPAGAVGYALAVRELVAQAEAAGVRFSRAFFPAGSGGTQAGLLAGGRLYAPHLRFEGVAVSQASAERQPGVARLAAETLARLGPEAGPGRFDPGQVIIHGDYVGPGYGELYPEVVEAIRLVARTEGVLLDPVYTGKAMAGLVDLVRRGAVGREETVVFWHTGGAPALFVYGEAFREPWWR